MVPYRNAADATGFENSEIGSAIVFRKVVEAMSGPGSIHTPRIALNPPVGLNAMTCAMVLTLCDMDTPLWIQPCRHRESIRRYVSFHTGSPIASDVQEATHVIVRSPVCENVLENLAIGTEAYPDRSATVLMMVDEFQGRKLISLKGPGIDGSARLAVIPVNGMFWEWRKRMEGLFPLGVDILFGSEYSLSRLPRSTVISTA